MAVNCLGLIKDHRISVVVLQLIIKMWKELLGPNWEVREEKRDYELAADHFQNSLMLVAWSRMRNLVNSNNYVVIFLCLFEWIYKFIELNLIYFEVVRSITKGITVWGIGSIQVFAKEWRIIHVSKSFMYAVVIVPTVLYETKHEVWDLMNEDERMCWKWSAWEECLE